MATYTITLNERSAKGKALVEYLQALGVLMHKVSPKSATKHRLYDPETGKLRQRVTESERELQSVLDQMRSLQAHIDSIETHRNDSLAAKTDEVTEKETETAITVPWYVGLGSALLLCALACCAARWTSRFVP